ncbi:DUF5753 domain-containing protein [Streptomyces sp. DSM 44917]|uniref:DUF5753 domain-containing protein n=1 Tax=Streptomyces boetiae TaxID=3075541 RepID=A0ABU2LEQ8_9ACTN|nr:DUF5753 domain-containing protein [Streptomyces sp. DSM 44917]MDT0310044.1 DUF5753 domain-containing protein [Streptomyces sp. DSM 44917]
MQDSRGQCLLTRVTDPPTLRAAIGEAILRRPLGGPKEMAAQLAHLVYVSELPNLDLRGVPFAAGPHPGILTGPSSIPRFPLSGDGTEAEPPTVYADGFTGGLYLDKPNEVQRFDAAFQEIWQASLDEQASRRLLAEVAGSYERQG